MTSNESNRNDEPTRARRRTWLLPAGLLLGGVLIAVAGTATGFWGGHHRGHGHGSHGFGGEKLRFGVEWMLRDLDASDEQVDAIVGIAEGAHSDLHGLADRHRENRAAFVAAFTADEIDPAAIEALRLETVAMAEEGSARIASALTAAAKELSPEQRRELAERHESFHAEHHDADGEE